MRHEGTRRDAAGLHIAYRCTSGALTIGYGHNLDANPVPGLGANSRISDDQAMRLLQTDVFSVQSQVERSANWSGLLVYPRYAVLVNMAYNLGISGLLGFKNTLGMVRRGDYSGAAKGMLASKWAAQVGQRAQELARQMETGQWQEEKI